MVSLITSPLSTIHKTNPWFKTGEVSPSQLESFKRSEFNEIAKDLNLTERATLIIGGRRVGKSVLIYQLIDYLLKNRTRSNRIFFIQGDNPILNEFFVQNSTKAITEILSLYTQFVLMEDIENLSEPVYIFIDEAHYIKGWDVEVKALIDLKYKIKFVITGSSSFQLRRGAQNPLVGRIKMQFIPPFTFFDYVSFDTKPSANLKHTIRITELRNDFQKYLKEGNINKIKEVSDSAKFLSEPLKLKSLFEEYIYYGGFPWVVSHKDEKEEVRKYLRDLLATTITKEIFAQADIRVEPQSFERLMVNICLYIGNQIKIKTLAEKLGLDERSVQKYIDYYIESHWVYMSSCFQFHKKTQSIHSERKMYVLDSGIINTLSAKDEIDLKKDRQYRGVVIENLVHNHLLSFLQKYCGYYQNSVPFWSDNDKSEVDFILDYPGKIIPVEVKSKTDMSNDDFKNINDFIRLHTSATMGIITTEDNVSMIDKLIFIPHYLLMYLI